MSEERIITVKDLIIKLLEQKELNDLLKQKRQNSRLKGHNKIYNEKKCTCGSIMIHVDTKIKSGGWSCQKEEDEWNQIITKLRGD